MPAAATLCRHISVNMRGDSMNDVKYIGRILVCPLCMSPRIIVEEAREIEGICTDGRPRLSDIPAISHYCRGCQGSISPIYARAILRDNRLLYIITMDAVYKHYDIYLQPVSVSGGSIYFDHENNPPKYHGRVSPSDITHALFNALDENAPPEQVQAAAHNFLSMLTTVKEE